MQSYWMTTLSPSAAAVRQERARRERTKIILRGIDMMVWISRSELDLELVEDGGPPAGAGLEGTVAAAVEMLADEIDLPAGPAVEPDVGAGGDGLDALAVDAAEGEPLELGL